MRRSAELMVKLTEFCGSSVILKCQLPKGDLETLISITNDEDLVNIIEEYDRASLKLAHPMKIRTLLLPPRSVKKVSSTPTLSSASSSASPSPSRSPHTSAESLPYAAAYRHGCNHRTPLLPAAYAIGVRNGSAKACCYTQFDGNHRFWRRGPHRYNYCH